MSSIQVLTLPGQKFHERFIAAQLAGLWQKNGHKVVVSDAIEETIDLVLVHQNCTWPEIPITVESASPILINGRVSDISKRRFSQQVIMRDSDWSGPVIIKTNTNYFGIPDLQRAPFAKLRTMFRRRITPGNWRVARRLPWQDYPIVSSLSEVPGWVWHNPELIVEKFLPERDGELFVLRFWLFFGDRSYGAKLWSQCPLIKNQNIVRYEYLDEVPSALQRTRDELGFDYGKFDYVIHEDQVVLLDVNTTPTLSESVIQHSDHLVRLAGSVEGFFHETAIKKAE